MLVLFLPFFQTLLFLFYLMLVWAAISCQLQKPKHRIWMNIVYTFVCTMIAWNLATRGGNPFVDCIFFNVKCSQKLANLGNRFLSTNSDPKVIDMFFALHVSASILFSSYPCFVFFSEMFVLVAISCELQKPIHRVWMNTVHVSMIALHVATRVGSLLWASNCIRIMQSGVQNLSIWETYFFPPIQIQQLLTCSLLCRCPLVFSSLPTLACSLFWDVCFGCHQLSAAETHI